MITYGVIGVLGLMYFGMSAETIGARRSEKVSIGPGEGGRLAALVRGHGNFAEYVPFLALMLYLVEKSGVFSIYIAAILGLLLIVSRVLHYLAFRGPMNFKLRIAGTASTLTVLVILSIMNIYLCFLTLSVR